MTVSATATSHLPVGFASTTPAVCATSGSTGATVTLLAVGTCTLTATQPGNSVYGAAPAVSRSFAVTRASQSITFGALAARTMQQTPLTVAATASSGLTVTFTASTPAVCTSGGVNGATITLVGAGTCTVRSDQPGNAIYNAAPAVIRSFTVTKVTQTITFATPANATLLDSPVTMSATATSGFAVTFSSSTLSICTAGGTAGATITLLKAGTCTIRADQAGDAIYGPAPAVIRSFRVS